MAEERIDIPAGSSDDTSVLRVLLHEVRGLSPVSSVPNLEISLDDDAA